MYDKGSIVVFSIINYKNKMLEYKMGEVWIIDVFSGYKKGERRLEYDIFVAEENCLYKHNPEEYVHTIPAFVIFLRMEKMSEEKRVEALKEYLASLETNFDINERDYYGNTILHVPQILKQPDLVKLAMKLGVLRCLNNEGQSQYDVAVLAGCNESAKLLKEMLDL